MTPALEAPVLDEPAPAHPVLVGRSGAAWRVVGAPLSVGGQALVYPACAEDDGHPVVVKVAREPGDADVRAEAELLLRFGAHPTLGPLVVPAWDHGEWEDRPFVVLERMERTLADLADRPLAERIAVLTRLVEAVRALHAHDVVHGDLKPANVLLDAEGTPFLADFGAAAGGGLTRGYVPPETRPGAPPDAARDRWALAGTAWTMLAGALPCGEARADRAAFDAAVPDRRALRDALLALRRPARWRRPRDLAGVARALRGEARPAARAPIAAALALVAFAGTADGETRACPAGYTLAAGVCERAGAPGLVPVPAGRFRMGESGPEDASVTLDAPAHDVTLTRGFWMMETEITQGAWARLLGENPVATRTTSWGDFGEGPCSEWLGDSLLGDERPVVCVTWREVVTYANALSAADGLAPAYHLDGDDVTWDHAADGWRLPTEAEWEWAARAGDRRPWAGAASRATVCTHANIRDVRARDRYPGDVECDDGAPALAPVKRYLPNAFGLHDMHGNAREWVWDIYGPYGDDARDPEGPRWGLDRVARGAGWYDGPGGIARRIVVPPDGQTFTIGARLVRSMP